MKTTLTLFVGILLGLAVGLSQSYFAKKPADTFSAPASPAAETAIEHAAPAPGHEPLPPNAAGPAAPVPTAPRAVLESLTEDDVDAWKKIREEKIQQTVLNGPDFWKAGPEADANKQPGRLDLEVLRNSLGTYQGTAEYTIPETKKHVTLNLMLALNGADAGAKNMLEVKTGTSTSRITFTWELLGSDGRDLTVVWSNHQGEEVRYVSNFAFKLPSGSNAVNTRLMGLDKNLHWAEIGTVDLKKIK